MGRSSSQQRLMHAETAGGIPVITVTGTPLAMGTSLGERLHARLGILAQDALQQLAQVSRQEGLFDQDGRIDQDAVLDWLQAQLEDCKARFAYACPSQWAELKAMAEVTDLRPELLLAIAALGDVLDRQSRERHFFSSGALSLLGGHSQVGVPHLVLNWWVPAFLVPHIVLVRRIPAHGPATLTLTIDGLHAVAGISASGAAVVSNNLRDAVVESSGLPSTLMVSLALDAPTYEDGIATLRRQPYFGARAVHLLGPGLQRKSLEISGNDQHELQYPLAESPRIHTNHRLHQGAPPDASSPTRQSQQLLQHLARHIPALNPQLDINHLGQWFHQIDNDQSDPVRRAGGGSHTVPGALVVCVPTQGRLYCRSGDPARELKAVHL